MNLEENTISSTKGVYKGMTHYIMFQKPLLSL